jgi:hypothetical protein
VVALRNPIPSFSILSRGASHPSSSSRARVGRASRWPQ